MKIIDRSCDFADNAAISRKIAADGMVLLKNRNSALPLAGKSVAVFGRGQFDFLKGGRGSSDVRSAYTVNLYDGLQEKDASGVLSLQRECSRHYFENPLYLPSEAELERFAQESDTALVVITRDSAEGGDTANAKGDFLPSDAETELLELLAKSPFRSIVLALNTGRVISLGFAADNDRIDAIALLWQPGMEGGAAAADVLSGEVNFSGRLTDTFAARFEDYPMHETWNTAPDAENYAEGIYTGYRYFETFAKNKVLYPFGFGLSYTTFRIEARDFSPADGTVKISCRVTNTGKTAGREVVQLYTALSGGKLDHPALELRAFAKTTLLLPGEWEDVTLAIPMARLRCFDETGLASGKKGSWIIDRGEYRFLAGSSVRNTVEAGRISRSEVEVLETPGLLFRPGDAGRMRAPDGRTPQTPLDAPKVFPSPIQLLDVAEGRASMDDFISQLSGPEMLSLCGGQPSAFARGTAGIGNLRKFGVPNAQTADGPAGLRKSVPTTGFPCATLIACSWDEKLQFAMGEAIGKEGIATGVDILLAPGLNLHRSPLCGRNFEYYSEDPLVSGRAAAAVVRGVQSCGMGATIKHFACNNRENNRAGCSSQVSERALRELYLAGFEIAVKEATPWCVMSSYNLLNGVKTSCDRHLLTDLLRGEWAYRGLVMTDWSNNSELWREIAAGNDLKMPFCHNGLAASLEAAESGRLSAESLRASVRRVLELVMKTQRFLKQDFGKTFRLASDRPTHVGATDFTSIASTWSDIEPSGEADGGKCVTRLAPILWRPDFPVRLAYLTEIEKAGEFDFSCRTATMERNCAIRLELDGGKITDIPLKTGKTWDEWITSGAVRLTLPSGLHTLTLEIRGLAPADWNVPTPGLKLKCFDITPAAPETH